ncbi:DsbA family oxidoreductase [Nocardioides sp. Y6]|uniref:DsbA family oxidoreductase n=2 Tax=Nocardioides malaquae TaxID=2773426 RepID=A0ABR9RTY8_9ACTN|nr:DsbA family oxidoreductase [Nocardioides malaquae]
MRIEIWSDVVCPWCYIGKRRLETALSDFAHADEVEVVWRSYQLDPTAPRGESVSTLEALGARFGGPDQVRQMLARTQEMAAAEGLHFGDASLHANTEDAHRLLHLALDAGGASLQGELKEALLAAHFVDNRDLGDHAVLQDVAVTVGLPAARVDAVLASQEYADAVRADVEQARAYGATGVPFFVVEGKYGVSGAQPVETFTQVLARAWDDSHPKLDLVGGGDAEACGPDGCAV